MAYPYSVAPHLEYLNVPFGEFAAARREFDAFGVGGYIFAHPAPQADNSSMPRVLLIQRAMTDSMPGCWEGPGGAAEPHEDRTLLDGVVREVVEETGLHVSRIVELTSVHVWFHARRGIRIAKYNFIVEIHEATRLSPEGTVEIVPAEQIPVELDANEHSAFDWVLEDELQQSLNSNGCGKYNFGPSIIGHTAQDVTRAFSLVKRASRPRVGDD
ncbi:Uncharacterized protein PECH_003412 [Penicillium ucsense]|uniref:Nudix hydrolase domain-containing protein n=2 Tax=Penicillium TaxID=5073 RepID=A0A8J8WAS8_9EURO|nr:uncharacterized protein N7539_003869 [Penicillium diatomitis]KAF7720293.1 Uncharacterized protein PECM_000222 [Penicillium ucsense]KAF7739433.1 Uncharacterized protein PECH_003412 [Penicillium ucsense]KAJ5488979.1 hypothetical protein N7539_003869 [Penicillium diatomitis]